MLGKLPPHSWCVEIMYCNMHMIDFSVALHDSVTLSEPIDSKASRTAEGWKVGSAPGQSETGRGMQRSRRPCIIQRC